MMVLNYDCWFVHFSDGKAGTVNIKRNFHEALLRRVHKLVILVLGA